MDYLPRLIEKDIARSLQTKPVTVVTGSRHSGKTLLAKQLLSKIRGRETMYLNLEHPSDLQKLDDPDWFFDAQIDKLVCIDGLHLAPALFSVLKRTVEERKRPGMYLLLGGASKELLGQDPQELFGYTKFIHLPPLLYMEVNDNVKLETYLTRGGYYPSLLTASDEKSMEWRLEYINSFLLRELPQFAGITHRTMRRLLPMLAYNNGQTVNYSKIGTSLEVSHNTIRNYIDVLDKMYMVSQLDAWHGKSDKRLVKSPKIYLSDPGITCALLQLPNFDAAYGHPVWASLWESVVLMHLKTHFSSLPIYFYRSSYGNEVDIIIESGSMVVAIECRPSLKPELSSGNKNALKDIQADLTFIASPVKESYPISDGVVVTPLNELTTQVSDFLGHT
jgi:uncharacterized protein